MANPCILQTEMIRFNLVRQSSNSFHCRNILVLCTNIGQILIAQAPVKAGIGTIFCQNRKALFNAGVADNSAEPVLVELRIHSFQLSGIFTVCELQIGIFRLYILVICLIGIRCQKKACVNKANDTAKIFFIFFLSFTF